MPGTMLLQRPFSQKTAGDDSQVQLLRHEKVGRLVLVEEVQLSGTVTGLVNLGWLQAVPTEADCIAVSFEDAKVCSCYMYGVGKILILGVHIILGGTLSFPDDVVDSFIRTGDL